VPIVRSRPLLAAILSAYLVALVFSPSTQATQGRASTAVKTVGQFARLPAKQRRRFAIRFMTTHPVDPCTNATTPLSRHDARGIAPVIVKYLKPGPDPTDGSYIRARTPVGDGIRHVLANVGC
jgi:hypothetical protein